MAHHFNRLILRIKQRLAGGVPQPYQLRQGALRFQARLAGAGALILAVFLGNCANFASEKEALRKWEKEHCPSDQVFDFAFGSRGWSPLSSTKIQDQKRIEKLIRNFPTTLDEVGSVWITSDANWVVLFSALNREITPRFYCHHCTLNPSINPAGSPSSSSSVHSPGSPPVWNLVGVGWRGLEKVIELQDQQLALEKLHAPHSPVKAKSGWRDPRAIRY